MTRGREQQRTSADYYVCAELSRVPQRHSPAVLNHGTLPRRGDIAILAGLQYFRRSCRRAVRFTGRYHLYTLTVIAQGNADISTYRRPVDISVLTSRTFISVVLNLFCAHTARRFVRKEDARTVLKLRDRYGSMGITLLSRICQLIQPGQQPCPPARVMGCASSDGVRYHLNVSLPGIWLHSTLTPHRVSPLPVVIAVMGTSRVARVCDSIMTARPVCWSTSTNFAEPVTTSFCFIC